MASISIPVVVRMDETLVKALYSDDIENELKEFNNDFQKGFNVCREIVRKIHEEIEKNNHS